MNAPPIITKDQEIHDLKKLIDRLKQKLATALESNAEKNLTIQRLQTPL